MVKHIKIYYCVIAGKIYAREEVTHVLRGKNNRQPLVTANCDKLAKRRIVETQHIVEIRMMWKLLFNPMNRCMENFFLAVS